MKTELLVRANILSLKPYSSARDEFSGMATAFLDANENPCNEPLNRYPDPRQKVLKTMIAENKKIPMESIFIGNGSDEAIDLLYRVFAEPGIDNVVAIDPTYGMYEVAAAINNVQYHKVSLNEDFSLNVENLLNACNTNTKMMFVCSPNNPTGNSFKKEEILFLLDHFQGILVLDEAYIDFSEQKSFLSKIKKYPRLVILQTFSKARALAAVRLGMAFAHPFIIDLLNKVKYPYNVSTLNQEAAIKSLHEFSKVQYWVSNILRERNRIMRQLKNIPFVVKVYSSDANFFLIKVKEPKLLLKFLRSKSIIVRDRSQMHLCQNCLRITVGARIENDEMIKMIKKFSSNY